jgi:hypothetical protein
VWFPFILCLLDSFGRIFINLVCEYFSKNVSKTFQVSLKSDNNNGTLHEEYAHL